ncbi:aminopeptidase [Cupriavidus gilardii]|uniref:aminopeptidase n=1 Tax=Cupriavidus gilardii TaxID=82541 RepID=UPI00157237AC|nr:aminopeptidase [Cupriavidus gilardii]MCG5263052.1 aminopeptidase [Cupriavidus gilardii]MDF9432000.1 aminopeptidase [Cupriavidus gilardii]NSX02528.1 aminopeptidase [Cupriavidus gilardii]
MTRRPARVRVAAALAALALGGLLAGCEAVGYYAQSISGHLGVMAQATPLSEAIAYANGSNDKRLAERLALAARMRDFASRELALPDNGSYRRYANLHRPYVVWSVFATPELSMELHKWCFLVVGCINYRGYYAIEDAHRYAAALRSEGLETYVAGVPAYSTLGYFDDPLLNTFVYLPEGELARMIFHELAHQVVYVRNDTTFNESFASAVEIAGVERWLAREASADARASYRQYDARRQQFRAMLLQARAELDALYRKPIDDDAKRAGKAAIFAALRQRYATLKESWGGYSGYDRWFSQPLTNAHLAAVATYQQWVPAFLALLEQCGGDWERFYAEAERIGKLKPEQRKARLRALAPGEAATVNAAADPVTAPATAPATATATEAGNDAMAGGS